jgi:hypothetical protein
MARYENLSQYGLCLFISLAAKGSGGGGPLGSMPVSPLSTADDERRAIKNAYMMLHDATRSALR